MSVHLSVVSASNLIETSFLSKSHSRWPPKLIDLSKHKNANCTDIEPKLDVVEADSHPQHIV